MNERTRLGLHTVGMALLPGCLGDGLLRTGGLGLNILLWVGALSAMIVAPARRKGVSPAGNSHPLIPVMISFALNRKG